MTKYEANPSAEARMQSTLFGRAAIVVSVGLLAVRHSSFVLDH
jgi:hypothetical protein